LGCLEELELNFGSHKEESWSGVPKGQTVRCNRWRNSTDFQRSNSRNTLRKEIIFGRSRRFWELRPTKLPENSTWYVMTEMTGLNYKDVGNLYGCRNWVEYGLNQSKK